ncbi:MAG: IS200/IS605 family transposase [Ardenticatenales bacterium]
MGRNRLGVYLHLVWGTWDREPLLTDGIEGPVHRIIGQEATNLGCGVVAVSGVADHVHVLLEFPATISIADLVRQIKGVSARWAADARGGVGAFKWQGSYGAFSISASHVDVVAAYVNHQEQHHAAGTLIPRLEFDPPPRRPSPGACEGRRAVARSATPSDGFSR